LNKHNVLDKVGMTETFS